MPKTTKDKIEAVLSAMAQAWNAGDATAYASQFTSDATYVSYQGHLLKGREAIKDVHQFLFDGPLKNTRLESTGDSDTSITLLRDDVALVVSGGGARLPDQKELDDRDSVQTMVLTCDDGHWLAAAFQNTRKQADR